MLLTHLFLASFLTPLALTIPPPLTDIPVTCEAYATARFDVADCEYLINDIRQDKTLFDWAHETLTWGPIQPWPSRTPLPLTYRSCRLEILARNPRSGASDVFKLADYFDALEEVLRVCFREKSGKTGGTTPLGGKNLFYAYIGGIPREKVRLTVGSGTSKRALAGSLSGALTS